MSCVITTLKRSHQAHIILTRELDILIMTEWEIEFPPKPLLRNSRKKRNEKRKECLNLGKVPDPSG